MPPRVPALALILLLLCAAPLGAQAPSSGERLGGGAWNEPQQRVIQATREEPLPVVTRSQDKVIPLSPPGKGSAHEGQGTGGALSSLVTIIGSLAVVLSLFFVVSWCVKRSLPKNSAKLPGDVIEVLGQARLVGRHQVHLVRCGNKLLLLSVTPAGADTLTEITDPVEVDRLAGLCRQSQPTSATANFRKLMDSFAGDNAAEDRDA
jgi:flagellar biogenesis protein FliO